MRKYLPIHLILCFILSLFLFAAPRMSCAQEPQVSQIPEFSKVPDVTARLEKLGIPHQKHYPDGEMAYARNIWDMIKYQNRIYLGCGAYDNSPPAANAGPVPVIAYDLTQKDFVTEHEGLPEEELANFKVFSDGLLYAPGIDPRQGWELGNFYRRKSDGTWETVRTMPKGVHNFDMTEFDGKLFCCGYGIGISEDRGATMILREMGLVEHRTYSFLRFPKTLFAMRLFLFQEENGIFVDEVNVYDPEQNDFPAVKIDSETLFPGLSKDFTIPEGVTFPDGKKPRFGVRVHKTISFRDRVVYLVLRKKAYLYSAENPDGKQIRAVELKFPEGSRVENFIEDNGKLYVLFNCPKEKEDGTKYFVNHVWRSEDALTFVPVLYFETSSFAKSLAIDGNNFFFGMGTRYERDPKTRKWDGKPFNQEAGTIYRVTLEPENLGS